MTSPVLNLSLPMYMYRTSS
ncbi:hypothetical protein GQ600_19963 [Phytophthora cactorum]|nr:hypothetical protein GQ600_19963 [Phytophthora cactorum]